MDLFVVNYYYDCTGPDTDWSDRSVSTSLMLVLICQYNNQAPTF